MEPQGTHIRRLVEKPQTFPNDLCGMGVYFLDDAVWDAVGKTAPGEQNKILITHVLQTLADTRGLSPVVFEGGYVNVNYPRDLVAAEKMYGGELKKRMEYNR